MNRLCVLLMVMSFLGSPVIPEDACKTPAKSAESAPKNESPFACDRLALTPEERTRHFDELGPALVARRSGVHELADGYEFKFPSDAKTFAMLAEWVEQERRCCPFFELDLRVEREGGAVWLRLTGRPGTKEFIRADGAKWIAE